MKMIKYVLMSDEKPLSWQLPLNSVLIKDPKDNLLKKVKFVPGVNSYFSENISGDLKPTQIWFTQGELTVPDVDKIQNDLLQAHPWFNVRYKIYDAQKESQDKLEILRATSRATELISDVDSDTLQAMALAIFGIQGLQWDSSTCELRLREFASQKPAEFQQEMLTKDYESKYLAALAFSKGVVKENIKKNAVIWNDTTEGIIVRIAKGERGLNKLSDFLSVAGEESLLVLQTIGDRLDRIETKTTPVDIISEKDKEIAALKKRLAEIDAIAEKEDDSELKQAQDAYFEKHSKKVPNIKKNDLDWIKSNS